MKLRPITATPSQVMVDQLVASGINYVFYNSGSREALFFDALEQNPNINGILALHEGSVASMAGGYTQVNVEPSPHPSQQDRPQPQPGHRSQDPP